MRCVQSGGVLSKSNICEVLAKSNRLNVTVPRAIRAESPESDNLPRGTADWIRLYGPGSPHHTPISVFFFTSYAAYNGTPFKLRGLSHSSKIGYIRIGRM